MGRKVLDMLGKQFGRLVVEARAGFAADTVQGNSGVHSCGAAECYTSEGALRWWGSYGGD